MGLTLTKTFQEKAARETQHSPQPPAIIDPSAPISSLAAAGQQFTFVADTNHKNPQILDHITTEMPSLAKAGVKKLMIEYTEDNRNKLFLKLLNHKPPLLTEQEILSQASAFASERDNDQKNPIGNAYVQLFAAAMKNGIQVVFAGDNWDQKEYDKYEQAKYNYDAYMTKNSKLERHSQKILQDPDHLKKLDIPEKEKRKLDHQITTHRNVVGNLISQKDQTYEAWMEARCGQKTEAERAKRIVGLAEGEKTVLIFGSLHFQKQNDLNEAIDKEVRKEAFKGGHPQNQRDSKVMEIWGSRTDLAKAQEFIEVEYKQKARHPDLRLYLDTMSVEIPEGANASFQARHQPEQNTTSNFRFPPKGDQLGL